MPVTPPADRSRTPVSDDGAPGAATPLPRPGRRPRARAASGTRCPDPAPSSGEPAGGGRGSEAARVRALRRARLAAMATPREGDSAAVAALRAVLADEAVMAEVTATVDTWPAPDEDQRRTIAALLHRPTGHA